MTLHPISGKSYLLPLLLVCASLCTAQTAVPVVLAPVPQLQFFDQSGRPLSFGCVFSYQSQTTTPLATFSDFTGQVQNQNPVLLNAGGSANIWLQSGQAYSLVVKSSGGNNCALGQTIYTVDGVGGGASQLNTVVTPSGGSAAFTVQSQNQLFSLTLTGNVAGSPVSFIGVIAPALVTFQITEDGGGAHTFTWPSNVIDPGSIDTTANRTTSQTFIWNGTTIMPVGLGSSSGNRTSVANLNNTFYVDGQNFKTPQQAIDAVPTSGGGEVVLPCGTFAVSDTVLNKSNLTVRGSGMCTHVQPSGGTGHYAFVMGDANPATVSSLQIRDLEIDCPGNADLTGGIFVRKGLSVGVVIENIKFRQLAPDNGAVGTSGGSCATDVQWGETAGGSIGSFDGVMSKLDIDLASTQIGIHISNGPNGPNGLTIERCSIRNGSLDPGLSTGILIEGQTFRTSIVNSYIEFMPGGNIVLRTSGGNVTGSTIISNNYMETYGPGFLLDIGAGVIDTVYRDNYTNSNELVAPYTTPTVYDIQIANGATGVLIENTRLQNGGTAAIHNLNSSAAANIVLRNIHNTGSSPTIDSATGVTQFSVNATGQQVVTPGVSTPIATVTSSVSADGGGFKHKRFGATCTTTTSIGNSCTTTFSWTTAFADANYTPICSPVGPANGPVFSIDSFNASGVTVRVYTFVALASGYSGVNCTAVHD